MDNKEAIIQATIKLIEEKGEHLEKEGPLKKIYFYYDSENGADYVICM